MKEIIHRINQFLAALCGWLLMVMAALLILDIISRGIKQPIQGIAEMSVFVMMVVIYLGMARCEESDEHVRIELLLTRLKPKARFRMLTVIDSVQLAVLGVFAYEMARNTWIAFRTEEAVAGTVQLPIWPVKVFIVIGLVVYWFQVLVNLADRAADWRRRPGSGASGQLPTGVF